MLICIFGCAQVEGKSHTTPQKSTSESTPHKDEVSFSKESITINGITLPYQQAVIGTATDSDKAALVIYLHGGSKKGNDNEVQMAEPGIEAIASYLAKRGPNAVMLVPQCPREMSWGGPMNAVLKGLLDSYVNRGIIDTSRIYAFGGSMGGSGTWGLISAYPGLFTAAMPVAGNPRRAEVKNIVPTAIYAVMGSYDRLMDVEPVETFIKSLIDTGGSAVLDIEEGWDHRKTCTESYTESRLQWVFAQEKD